MFSSNSKKRKDTTSPDYSNIKDSQKKKAKIDENLNKSSDNLKFSPNSMKGGFQNILKKGTTQVKKISFKTLLEAPKLPIDYLNKTSEKLKLAVNAIHNQSHVGYSLEELYTDVDNICTHKMASSVYNNLKEECEKYSLTLFEKIMEDTNKIMDSQLFLRYINSTWINYCEQMVLIRGIFLTLDRKYAIPSNEVQSIWDMGLNIFKNNIAIKPVIKERTLNTILQQIKNERNGETIDRNCIRSLLKMYISLGMYSEYFEPFFLKETQTFYEEECENMLNNLQPTDYLLKVENRIKEEYDRINHYLDQSTQQSLIQSVERILISDPLDTILSKGLNILLDENRSSDIHRMYTLVRRVNAEKKMKTAWSDYIKKKGCELIQDESKDQTMIEELLEFKEKLGDILKNALESNKEFEYSLKDSFESFINTREIAPSELLAKYIHNQLRQGSKSSSDVELETLFDKVIQIFRYINGKDVFEAFYKNDLAKRLLTNKSFSIDIEKSMISRLKAECGSQYTQKLEGMIKDIEVSEEMSKDFQTSDIRKESNIKIDMDISVLTTGFWPSFQPVDIKLPTEMGDMQKLFNKFYTMKHSGRHLIWLNTHGSCVVRSPFAFKSGKIELTVSVFQAVILILFNDSEKMTLSEIKSATGITDDNELKRTLQSLCMGKHRALLKEPAIKSIEDDHIFKLNSSFKANKRRIVINQFQMKESTQEQIKTKEKVFLDRQYQVDAAIVRIMKTRKKLTHTELLTELYDQLKFNCQASDLKKRIEMLIEREYLARSPEDPSVYNYIS